MRHQATTSSYGTTGDMNLHEEGEFIETIDIDSTIVPPADAKRSEARRLIEQMAETKRLNKELNELDWFHSDDDLQ